MTLPGTVISERDQSLPRTSPTDTGVLFVAGLTEKGPVDAPALVTSPTAFTQLYGADVSYSVLPAYVETAMREGAAKVYVQRVVGPAATAATVTLKDATSADALKVDARDPGAAGANLRVAVVAGSAGGTFVLVISDVSGAELERSPDLADNAAAVSWASASAYVRATALAGTDAAPIAAQPLVGGSDDRASVTDATKVAALAKFSRDLGPGQVAIPGGSTTTTHDGILSHCLAQGQRKGLLDLPDVTDASTMKTAAAAVRALGTKAREGAIFGLYAIVPGVVPGTTRRVPYSAVVAGHVARNDAATGNPNIPAAGINGRCTSGFVLGISAALTDADRETLNDAGVNVPKVVNGEVRTYGFRTVADPVTNPLHWQFANVRLDMAVYAKVAAIAEDEVFAVIDGQGIEAAHFGGRVSAVLADFYRLGALYGATADDAYSVDVGPSVNTPETIAEGRLRVVTAIRRSPMAERAEVEVVKVAVTGTV